MNHEDEVVLLRRWTTDEVCGYLGSKVRGVRQKAHESQEQFAKRAGIPLRTYKRFETHGKASLETFIQVLRAIERTPYLFMLFPQSMMPTVKEPMEERLRKLRPTKFL